MHVVHVKQIVPVPWRNGQGQTREIDIYPAGASYDNFLWRVSLADIRQNGDFSAFSGIDRIITLVKGTDVTLNFHQGDRQELQYASPYAFQGEQPVHATLGAGPVQDLNLMMRRDLVHGHIQAKSDAFDLLMAADVTCWMMGLKGQWQLTSHGQGATHETVTLGPFDYLRLPATAGTVSLTPASPEVLMLVAHINVSEPGRPAP